MGTWTGPHGPPYSSRYGIMTKIIAYDTPSRGARTQQCKGSGTRRIPRTYHFRIADLPGVGLMIATIGPSYEAFPMSTPSHVGSRSPPSDYGIKARGVRYEHVNRSATRLLL